MRIGIILEVVQVMFLGFIHPTHRGRRNQSSAGIISDPVFVYSIIECLYSCDQSKQSSTCIIIRVFNACKGGQLFIAKANLGSRQFSFQCSLKVVDWPDTVLAVFEGIEIFRYIVSNGGNHPYAGYYYPVHIITFDSL